VELLITAAAAATVPCTYLMINCRLKGRLALVWTCSFYAYRYVLGLTQIDPLLSKICKKNNFYIFVIVTLTLTF